MRCVAILICCLTISFATHAPGTVCLAGTPREKVQAIAKAFMSESFSKVPVLMDDVPTKERAGDFLRRFFPCVQSGS